MGGWCLRFGPRLRGVAVGLAAVAASLGPSADEPPENIADLAAIVRAHNREREANKQAPLSPNPKLEAAALAHARDMAAHQKMSHEGTDGSTPAQRIERAGYRYRSSGENVAEGQGTVEQVMRSWMDSPPHKKNVLGDFTEIGAACVKAKDGTPYWAVDFGLPWPELDPDAAAADVVSAFNRQRAQRKAAALKVNPKLEAVARRHARDMAAHDEFRTKDDDGLTPFERVKALGYRYRRLGEATASGQPTAEEAVRTWLEDSSNRENILGDFDHIGVGYARSEKGIPYWCLIFGKALR